MFGLLRRRRGLILITECRPPLIICKCGQSLKLGNQDKNILAEPVSQSPGLSGITDSVGCGNMEGIHSGKGAC